MHKQDKIEKRSMLHEARDHSLIISDKCSVLQASNLLNSNMFGIIFVVDQEERLTGSVTKREIERFIEQGQLLDNSIQECMQKKPLVVNQGEDHRKIIHLLNKNTQAVPEIDMQGRLISVITIDNFIFTKQRCKIVHSRAPARVSFAGGGTDLPYFFEDHSGVVLSTTIKKYAHAILAKREDSRIIIHSSDFNITEEFRNISEIDYSGKLALLKAVIKMFNPHYGFDLITYSETPLRSGLGASASIAATVVACFYKLHGEEMNLHQIVERAYHAERVELGIQGGWQDQYATVFGGLNYIEFNEKATTVHPLKLPLATLNELESNLILCYTGKNHDSGSVHKDLKKQYFTDNKYLHMMKQTKKVAIEMEKCLIQGRLNEFAQLLDQGWQIKRNYSCKIYGAELDNIYNFAREHGAVGGKMLGAGGGYFLFYADTFRRSHLEQSLNQKGLLTIPIVFDDSGICCWFQDSNFSTR